MKPDERQKLYALLESPLTEEESVHEISWILDHVRDLSLKSFREMEDEVLKIIQRKKNKEPLQYIFGNWAFRGYTFKVGPGVLIPRPETEELVESAIMSIENSNTTSDLILKKEFRVVDLGAGSGCIGLSFVADLLNDIETETSNSLEISKNIHLTLVEKSPEARKYLYQNLELLRPKLLNANIEIVDKDWINWDTTQKYNLLMSNPPYLNFDEYKTIDTSVRDYEPRNALMSDRLTDTDEMATQSYREIVEIAEKILFPEAWIFLELSPLQAEWIQGYVSERKTFNDLRTLKDMAKIPRIFCAKRKGE